ncbi:PRC-barrel domain-containing protein [Elioraea rosea]|uniref:PRC-barrel domain-containing protein n=1 Tax=Elioraea rosea TaxID=2492390 RepID=UPI0013151FD0|nr:PRC-barrel domain-containing protein [Elioraea rosea]
MSTRLPLARMTLAAGLMAAPMLAFAQAPATPASPAMPAPSATQPATPTAPMATAPATRMGPATIRASKVIGANVYNEQNESIGEVEDLVIPAGQGPMLAVVSVGGFLGIGERLVSVPMNELRWNAERERWSLAGATKESLKNRPEFRYEDRRG